MDDVKRGIKRYPVWGWLDRELSSDIAGETGAVFIYRGAKAALRHSDDKEALAFVTEHQRAEEKHLSYLEQVVRVHTRLLPVWRVLGWTLGFAPTFVGGPPALYATVFHVESFVEQHYKSQIAQLNDPHPDVQAVKGLLERCCADEVHHKDEALARFSNNLGYEMWGWVVRTGSALAAECARRF